MEERGFIRCSVNDPRKVRLFSKDGGVSTKAFCWIEEVVFINVAETKVPGVRNHVALEMEGPGPRDRPVDWTTMSGK
jgi:hypothetical protein